MQAFMDGIADLVNGLVQTYHCISEEQKSMFGNGNAFWEIPALSYTVNLLLLSRLWCKNNLPHPPG